jgi:hypothetical protein
MGLRGMQDRPVMRQDGSGTKRSSLYSEGGRMKLMESQVGTKKEAGRD